MMIKQIKERDTLKLLSWEVKNCIEQEEYEKCGKFVRDAMCEYPDSPVPHNLMGILYEKWNNPGSAMKHFRAAYALDPAYLPAKYNLEKYEGLNSKSGSAFSEEDCIKVRVWQKIS